MLRVYIAGPISKDPLGGTRAAIDAASFLADIGCAPYVPHLCVLWELSRPRKYEEWMKLGFEWLSSCDAVLRLPGESAGAEAEVAVARELGLPVFESLDDVQAWAKAGIKTPRCAGLEDAAFSAMASNIRTYIASEERLRAALRAVLPFAESRVEDLVDIDAQSTETARAVAALDSAITLLAGSRR